MCAHVYIIYIMHGRKGMGAGEHVGLEKRVLEGLRKEREGESDAIVFQ